MRKNAVIADAIVTPLAKFNDPASEIFTSLSYEIKAVMHSLESCDANAAVLGSNRGLALLQALRSPLVMLKEMDCFTRSPVAQMVKDFKRVFSDVQRRGLKCTQVAEQFKSLHISLQEQVKGSVVLPSADDHVVDVHDDDDSIDLIVGDAVVLVNLVKQPELNGKFGEITGWDAAKHRFHVRIAGTTDARLLKPHNLQLAEW